MRWSTVDGENLDFGPNCLVNADFANWDRVVFGICPRRKVATSLDGMVTASATTLSVSVNPAFRYLGLVDS